MILVDTSVWVDHLRANDGALVRALEAGIVVMHPFVVGELACGNLANRAEVLGLLQNLPAAPVATGSEALGFIEARSLIGRGIGGWPALRPTFDWRSKAAPRSPAGYEAWRVAYRYGPHSCNKPLPAPAAAPPPPAKPPPPDPPPELLPPNPPLSGPSPRLPPGARSLLESGGGTNRPRCRLRRHSPSRGCGR